MRSMLFANKIVAWLMVAAGLLGVCEGGAACAVGAAYGDGAGPTQAAAQEDAQPSNDQSVESPIESPVEDNSVVTYDFRTPHISRWLTLGPIAASDIPDDPATLVAEASIGGTREFLDSGEQTWKVWESQNGRDVSLLEYCREAGRTVKGAVCYTCVKLEAGAGNLTSEKRAFRYSTNDAVRAWVIDEDDSSEQLQTKRFTIDFSQHRQRYLLLEVSAQTDLYYFEVECGRTWRGQVTYPDGVTPNPNVIVDLFSSNGQRLNSAKSAPNGNVVLSPVPYSGELTLRAAGRETKPKWLLDEDTNQRAFRIKAARPPGLVVTEFANASRILAMPVIAISHDDRTGHIRFLQEGARDRIQVIVGKNVYTHPFTEQLPNLQIVDFCFTDDGTLYLQVDDFGLLCINESRRVQYFGRERLEGFTQVTSPDGKIFTGGDLLRSSGDAAWISMHRSVKPNSSGQATEAAESLVCKLQGPSADYDVVLRHPGVLGTLYADRAGIAFSDRGRLLQYARDGTKTGDSLSPFTLLRSCTRGPSGKLWVASEDGLATLQEDGTWKTVAQVQRVSADANISTYVDDNIWLAASTGTSLIEDGVIKNFFSIDHTASAPWGNSGVLLGTADGRILGLDRASSQPLDPKDGVVSGRNWKVSASPHGVVLSGLNMRPWRQDSSGSWRRLPKYGTITGFPISEDETLAIVGGLEANSPELFNVPPVVIRMTADDAELIKLPVSQGSIVVSDILHTRNDRLLIGSHSGLFEYRNGAVQLVPPQEKPSEIVVHGLSEGGGGEIWIGTADGRFGQLKSTGIDWIRLPQPEGGLRQARHFATPERDSPTLGDHLLVGTNLGLYQYDLKSRDLQLVDTPFSAEANIQDIATSPLGGPIMLAVRGVGVYSLHNGFWSQLKLDDATDLSDVWDIEHEPNGRVWFTTSHSFVSYRRAERKPYTFVDSIKTDGDWVTTSLNNLVSPHRTEQDVVLQVRLSTSLPSTHAGYRYRLGSYQPWKTILGDDNTLALKLAQSGDYELQVQSFDRDHNLSDISKLALSVYLPVWRWQIVRWSIIAGVALALVAAAVSVLGLRRARRAKLNAEVAAREAAETSAREREGLLLRVCHDLKNPLNVVFACTEMLDNGELSVAEASPLLNGSAESMSYLSQQLLSYSRLHNNNQQNTPVFLRSFIADIKREFKLASKKTSSTLQTNIAADLPPWLICDPYMLKEILSNLIDNSIKHCPSGVIQLRAFVDDGQPSLVVEDTGPGIPSDQLEKIFEAFFQAGENGVNQQGVGLGLAICKTLTERLGGTITASNCDTGGARFTVKFPASAASTGTQEPGKIQRFDQAATPESATSRKPHFTLRQARGSILVVDDLPFVGHTLTRILTQAGCNARYASPFDTMSICRAGSFDEALVDLNMQGQDGFEIARQLRDLYGNAIRIHAMSESDYLLSLAQDSALFDSATSKTTLFRAPEKEEKKDPSL